MQQQFRRKRGSKKAYPITPRTLYGAPRYKKYSELLSKITNNAEANNASFEMQRQFEEAGNRGTQVRIKRALVERANRARVESRNQNLSSDARSNAAIIADVLEYGYHQMDIPPANGTGVVITKSSSQDLTLNYKVVTWQNGKKIVASRPLSKAKAQEMAKGEREALKKGYYLPNKTETGQPLSSAAKAGSKALKAEKDKKITKLTKIEKLHLRRNEITKEIEIARIESHGTTSNKLDALHKKERDLNKQIAKQILTEKAILSKEKAAVKDEAQGEKDYKELANLARKEGRHEDAKVYEQHAADEKRHKIEDQKIVTKQSAIEKLTSKLEKIRIEKQQAIYSKDHNNVDRLKKAEFQVRRQIGKELLKQRSGK